MTQIDNGEQMSSVREKLNATIASAEVSANTLSELELGGGAATINGTQTLTNKTLSSPTLTGVPTAPTAVQGTNTTQVATTEFATATAAALAALYAGAWVDSVAALVADTALTYSVGAGQVTVGQYVRTRSEGFSYKVLGIGSATADIATAGGVLLEVQLGPDGAYNFAALAPAADGTTDDYPKLEKLLSRVGTMWSARQMSIPAIFFPDAEYFFSESVQLKRSVWLRGNGSGMAWDSCATFKFPVGVKGIIIHRHDTIDDGIESPATIGGDCSIIEGINVIGPLVYGVPDTNLDAHGIWLRARAIVRNVRVRQFAGNAINIVATSGGAANVQGNANLWRLDTCRLENCGNHGLYVQGADVNAGVAIGVDATANGRCGIFDQSFLGNTYIGCHTDANGLATGGWGRNASDQSSYVTYGGKRYAAHWLATEAQLVATTPGTDASIWVYDGSGGTHPTIPLWTSGKPEGTYFVAFSYFSPSANARNSFNGCYAESGQPGAAFSGRPTIVVGGIYGRIYTGNVIETDLVALKTTAIAGGNGSITARLGHPSEDTVLAWLHTDDGGNGAWRLKRSGLNYRLDCDNLGGSVALTLSGRNTADVFGGAVAKPYILGAPNGVAIGSGSNARRIVMWSTGSVPASGDWGQGEIAVNRNPSPSNPAAWICTTAGTGGSTAVFKAITLPA